MSDDVLRIGIEVVNKELIGL